MAKIRLLRCDRCFSFNFAGRNQHLALSNLRATYRKSNALCIPNMRVWTLYAVECCAVTEFRALCLPMNALCPTVGIGYTITEMCTDCLYLAGKSVKLINFLSQIKPMEYFLMLRQGGLSLSNIYFKLKRSRREWHGVWDTKCSPKPLMIACNAKVVQNQEVKWWQKNLYTPQNYPSVLRFP